MAKTFFPKCVRFSSARLGSPIKNLNPARPGSPKKIARSVQPGSRAGLGRAEPSQTRLVHTTAPYLSMSGAVGYCRAWAWGGMGGYIPPPKDLHTSGQNWLGGVWQFFPRSKKLFGRNRRPFFFFLLAAGELFGSWGGVYTPPPSRRSLPPPPQRKKRAHQIQPVTDPQQMRMQT